jgi:hypothetical protein
MKWTVPDSTPRKIVRRSVIEISAASDAVTIQTSSAHRSHQASMEGISRRIVIRSRASIVTMVVFVLRFIGAAQKGVLGAPASAKSRVETKLLGNARLNSAGAGRIVRFGASENL